MNLRLPNHPVGTKFLGHRWQYEERALRRNEFAMEMSSDAEPRTGQRRAGGLEAYVVREYSPSGIFVRMNGLGSRGHQVIDGVFVQAPEDYGWWARAEVYEVIEELP